VVSNVVAGELRRHRFASHYSRDGDPVFASNTGTVLRVHNLRERSFRPLLERLGWAKQGFGLHSFRRSYVSALIANGLDVANVSKYAGHASPTITLDRYARPGARGDGGTVERNRRTLNLRQLATCA
jgi:integrase